MRGKNFITIIIGIKVAPKNITAIATLSWLMAETTTWTNSKPFSNSESFESPNM